MNINICKKYDKLQCFLVFQNKSTNVNKNCKFYIEQMISDYNNKGKN